MANKDLSQNVEINVSVNPQSIKKAQDEINSLKADFMVELRKELGFGQNTKIRVGGYSTGESLDRTVRNKAASKIEKMGGDWSGIDIADKAEVEIAKNINEAAKELAQRIGIKFVDQFAATIGEADFALPDNSLPAEKLSKTIEDFIADAAGGVTISPAMLLAASERVYKNNPNISVPGGLPPTLTGAISPTNIFPEGAAVDEEVTRQFNEFLGKAVGNNDAAANAVQALLMNKLKIVFSGIIDAGQKAREATFKNAKVAEGDDAAEGLVRYADNAARAAIALQEMLAGLQQGTTAAYARGIVPGKFESKPEAISDPAQLANVLVGDYQDLVTGALMSSLPDPKAVADPIAQVLLNPYILGDKFVSGYEKSVNAAIKRGTKNSANVGDAVAAAPAATPMGPLEKYRPVLGDAIVNQIVKLIGEAGGDVSKISAAFDTEFIQNNATPIYEAGVTIKNSMGEFIDILKMVQIPSGSANDINFALKQAGAGAQSVGDIKKRGEMLGLTSEQMGTGAGDVADIKQYREKLIQLGTLLQALDEVGVQVAGSNIVDADFRMLAKTFSQVNQFLGEAAGIEAIKVPAPTNIVDFKKIIAELAKVPNLAPELGVLLQKVIKDGVTKGGTDLGELLAKAIDMQPAIAERYNVQKQGKGFAIDGMQAHVAVADNRASLIVLDFLKQFAQSAELIKKGTSVLGANYGGGTAGPYSNKTREDYSSAFGGGFSISPADRAKAADALVQETAAQEDNNRAVRTGTELAQQRLTDDKEYKKLLEQLTDAQAAYNAMAKIESNKGIATPAERAAIEAYITRLDELGETSLTAKAAAESLRVAIAEQSKTSAFIAKRDLKAFGEEKSLEVAKKAYEAEAAVKEIADKRKAQSGRNYENTATQVERNVTMAASERGRRVKLANEDEEKSRKATTEAIKGNTKTSIISIEQEAKARKDASDQIKRIYKDQVEAEKAVQAATKASINQWVTGRYALYDVGNAYQNVSTQLFRVARRIFDITKSYRDYETAFTSVERAMQLDFSDPSGSAQELKDQFIALSEVIPVAFEELSRIATLGAQMGIGAKGIVQFTETVAQFAAVTGISADTVAQKFGRIAELTDLDSSDFYKLGSAVTFAGVNAVATESEILTLSESIAAVSNQAGMTAAEVVGIATSLASIGVPAEQARGVFTRVFADIDRAVATGGKSLDAFAATAGMSGEELSKSWGTQGGSYDVLRGLLGGLNGAQDLTKAFDALNIVETREINTLTRLANNLNVVDGAVSDSNASFGEGQFLLESFGKTTDNLDSKITIFQNNIKSLGEQIGQNFGSTLKRVVDVGSEVAKVLKEMSKSPMMQFLTNASLGMTVLGGLMTGFYAVMAKVVAQIYAFRVAMVNSANDPTAVAGIGKQLKQLTNFRTGLIEMRNELQTPNAGVRGQIAPVDFGMFGNMDKEIQRKLEVDNLYIASGDRVLDSIDERKKAELGLSDVLDIKKANDSQRVFLARTEADQINKLVQERKNEIENLRQVTDTSTKAGRAKIAEATSSQILYRWVNGEAVAYTQAEIARAKGIVSGKIMANTKQKEAAAHLLNSQAINAETQAASKASTGIMSVGSRVMGFLGGVGMAATLLTTVVGIIQGIVTAVNEANKLDLAGSGLTAEALKETITQDTQAWLDNGKAIATQTVEYEKSVTSANKYASAVAGLSDSLKKAYGSQLSMEKATRSQTVAFGDATKQLVINAILANKKITELIDKNTEMFNDLANIGFNASDVIDNIMGDPETAQRQLEKIKQGVKDISKEIGALSRTTSIGYYGGAGSDVIGASAEDMAKLRELKQRKVELEALGTAGQEAFDQIQKAITMNNVIEVLRGYAEGFTGLEAKMKSAAKAGKGMTAVLKEVAAAVIATSNITNAQDIMNINSAKSIDEMIKIVKGLREVEIAAIKTAASMRNVSIVGKFIDGIDSSASFDSAATKYDGTIRSLELLKSAGKDAADSLKDVGKSAEDAATKLMRLLDAAFSKKEKLIALSSAVKALGASMTKSKDWSFLSDSGAQNLTNLQNVIKSIGEKAGTIKKTIPELKALKLALQDAGAPAAAIAMVNAAISKLGGTTKITAKQAAALRKEFAALFNLITQSYSAGVAQATEEMKKDIKTLTDYASDLSGVLQSAFNFRYERGSALDSITSSWLDMKEAADSAADAIKKANDELAADTADKAILEYQLSVAERYNDEKRAASIRAKLAQLNQKMADTQQEITDAQDEANKSLTGNSKAAINNRAKVRDLVTQYNAYLVSLANSGMSTEELKGQAAQLEQEFLNQGEALGFSRTELESYTNAFKNDFTTVIDRLPKDITLQVDTDPALRAINEFVAKAKAALDSITTPIADPAAGTTPPGSFLGTRPGPDEDGTFVGQFNRADAKYIWDGTKWLKRVNGVDPNAKNFDGTRPGPDEDGTFTGQLNKADQKYIWDNENRFWIKRARGGAVYGPGGPSSDKIPAMLSNGEYVIQSKAARTYGLDFLNALNQQRVGFSPVQAMPSQAQGNSGPQMVYLSPEDRSLLRQAIDRPVNLYTENQKIAESANAGNVILAQRGAR